MWAIIFFSFIDLPRFLEKSWGASPPLPVGNSVLLAPVSEIWYDYMTAELSSSVPKHSCYLRIFKFQVMYEGELKLASLQFISFNRGWIKGKFLLSNSRGILMSSFVLYRKENNCLRLLVHYTVKTFKCLEDNR